MYPCVEFFTTPNIFLTSFTSQCRLYSNLISHIESSVLVFHVVSIGGMWYLQWPYALHDRNTYNVRCALWNIIFLGTRSIHIILLKIHRELLVYRLENHSLSNELEISQPSVTKIDLNTIYLNIHLFLSGTNVLATLSLNPPRKYPCIDLYITANAYLAYFTSFRIPYTLNCFIC